jgi:mannose-6-phosphate isomerase-like protein (cupin superfamily)
MPDAPYHAAHLSELPGRGTPGLAAWRAVRIHFGIRAFGVNAYVAEADGDELSPQHTEVDDSGTRHEELYFVASGHARFIIGGEALDAPTGTFVYVPDPAVARGASALETGTTLLAVGGEPGKSFEVSPWEKEYAARA